MSMRRLISAALPRAALLCMLAIGPAARTADAIEMFTFFGDGSRIGLPSLEVPIEAYRGIPLRSDRIRARTRAMQAGRHPGRSRPGGITIRREQPLGAPPGVPEAIAAPLPGPR